MMFEFFETFIGYFVVITCLLNVFALVTNLANQSIFHWRHLLNLIFFAWVFEWIAEFQIDIAKGEVANG